ncbi:MAG: class II aldolase/adducin family protein [Candidatus Helarchaeota archaeon]|nr:class II aldolase/adducin family protein [Candidatus Helarchaeota archaeon]
MIPYEKERREVLEIAQKMLHKGHVVGTSGNVSMRIKAKSEDEEEVYAITPSDMDYDEIDVEDIVIMNARGKRVKDAKGKRNRPSVEKLLHLGIYEIRSDVNGIIHTHSLFPSAVSLLADSLPNEELPAILEDQTIFLGGAIKIAKYAPTGSPELAKTVHETIGDKACLILRHHGAVCVGKNLQKAYRNVELLNKTAKIFIFGSALGKLTPLSPEALEYALRLYAATRQI